MEGKAAFLTLSLHPGPFGSPRAALAHWPNGSTTQPVAPATQKYMSESFAALFEESLKRSEMRTGEVITAEVVRIEHNHVVVNAGIKSEDYVPIE